LGGGWDKDEFCSSVCYDFETWNFFFLKRERGTGCEGEVNKDESVCLFVFNGSYVSVSSPVVLCEQGWSKNNGVGFILICTVSPQALSTNNLHTVYKYFTHCTNLYWFLICQPYKRSCNSDL
jgi:hypothetical protein